GLPCLRCRKGHVRAGIIEQSFASWGGRRASLFLDEISTQSHDVATPWEIEDLLSLRGDHVPGFVKTLLDLEKR
ncbi:MAG TPA: hypothetical protein PLV56_07825, partial [Synergistales bacterium]|nr:hypothetical protein [Synergistales bacterium]